MTGAALSEDGQLVLTYSYDRTARLWNMQTGLCHYVLKHDKVVTGAAIAPDVSRVVTTTDDHQGHLWDLFTGMNLCELQVGGQSMPAAVRAQGCSFAIVRRRKCLLFDGQRYDAAIVLRPADCCSHARQGHKEQITDVAFSPCSAYAATCSVDCTLRLYDADSGRCLCRCSLL